MGRIEEKEYVYYHLNGGVDSWGEKYAGKGGQGLSVSDKFLINKEVDRFIDECGEEFENSAVSLYDCPVIAFFAPRLQQYGFEVPVEAYIFKRELVIAEKFRRIIKRIQEKENENK